MFPRASVRALRAARQPTFAALRYTSSSHSTDNPMPANTPNPKEPHSPVYPNTTNAMATSSEGAFDKVLQEGAEQGEKLRVMQAPNREMVWSRSQKPRKEAMVGPRFEQSIMEDQVCANKMQLVRGGWG